MVSLRDLNEGMTNCESFPLVCPICRGELTLENPYRRLGRVRTGKILCSKGCATFPIIYGVPIMLLPGQPASWVRFYKRPWNSPIPRRKQNLMEALAAGEFDKERRISGSPVTQKAFRKAKRVVSKAGWERHLKSARTSSKEPNAVAIGERLRKIKTGVVVDMACGGGFTTERVLQEIQPSVYSVSIDIDFLCVKLAGRRAEVLGMSDRSTEMCADSRSLPFADESVTAAYTRNGFNHIGRYVDALKEAYRILKPCGYFVDTEGRSSMWSNALGRFGLDHEEKLEVLHKLSCFTNKREFIENVKETGFSILDVEDLPKPWSHYFIVEAVKN